MADQTRDKSNIFVNIIKYEDKNSLKKIAIIIIIVYFHNSNLKNDYCRPQLIWITWTMCFMACISSFYFLQNFVSFLQNFVSFLESELDNPADHDF